jgi:hypothetical protein
MAEAQGPYLPGALRHCLQLIQAFDNGVKLLEAAERHGLEGIVSKHVEDFPTPWVRGAAGSAQSRCPHPQTAAPLNHGRWHDPS